MNNTRVMASFLLRTCTDGYVEETTQAMLRRTDAAYLSWEQGTLIISIGMKWVVNVRGKRGLFAFTPSLQNTPYEVRYGHPIYSLTFEPDC